MKLENLMTLIQVLKYIKEHPKCVVPDMKEAFGIIYSNPPSQDEKDIYKVISTLHKKNYIQKIPFETRELGGPHFSLSITELGKNLFNQVGISSELLPHSEKEKILDSLKTELRLIIREVLKGKVSKPLSVEIVPDLTDALINGLNTFLKEYKFIRVPN